MSMELRGIVKNYDWGKLGADSLVGTLFWIPKNPRKLKLNLETNYAELWIGTHPEGEAKIRLTKEKLSDYIKRKPEVLGISRYQFGDNFPFMFKIISVASAVSIQMYPNERQARLLHKAQPNVYPDLISKPEIVIALTDFEIMAGFRQKNEIIYFLKDVPELRIIIKPSAIHEFLKTKKMFYFKKVVEFYVNAEVGIMTEAIDKYFERMEIADSDVQERHLYHDILKLQKLYPYDKGVFGPFFFNYFTLKPEEAVYLPPTMPHSYLLGDAVVCSSSAVNHVCFALTSRYKDTKSFAEFVDLTFYQLDDLKVKTTCGPYDTIYDCDEDEFVVSKITVHKDRYHTIYGKRTFCIFIVIKGTGLNQELTKIKNGTIIFIPPCQTYHLRALEEMVLYLVEPNLVI